MGRNTKNKSRTMRHASAVLVVILAAALLAVGLMAAFTSEGTVTDQARVAAFVFNVKDGTDVAYLDLTEDIKNPGDTVTYTFEVTNKDGETIAEVLQDYTVELELTGSMPLTCVLEKGTGNDAVKVGTMDATAGVVTMNAGGSLEAAVETTETYVLTVTWPETENDVKYANGSGVAELELRFSS